MPRRPAAAGLAAVGVRPVPDLPGVGRNLHDQPCAEVWYEGSAELTAMMERHRADTGWQPHEQVIAKFPSAGYRQGFDLHIYPVGGYSENLSPWFWFLGAACLTPLSRGSVRLTGPGIDNCEGSWARRRARVPDSVVDADGRVHGIEGLYVADASIMPTVTSGNTDMPVAVIGERIARSLLTA